MIFDRDIEQLNDLAKYFFNIAKTPINIYDEMQNSLAHYSKPSNTGEFCSYIRKNKEINEKCIRCDRKAFERCKKTGKMYIYKCHMGLVEVAAPIIYNNIIFGYMLFGQIADSKDKTDVYINADKLCDEYEFDKEKLYDGIKNIKYRSKDYIESISMLLEMCSNYIWMKDYIKVKKEGVAYTLDQYIRDNLSNELSVEILCKKFGLSRSSLYRISKENFKKGISEYILDLRIDKAKRLLKEEILSVGEVAERVGFPDTAYFSRIFRLKMGLTPKKYQKEK